MTRRKNENTIEQARTSWQEGKTQKEIAGNLGVSERTVRRWLADQPKPEAPQAASTQALQLLKPSYEQILALVSMRNEEAMRLWWLEEMAGARGNNLPSLFYGGLLQRRKNGQSVPSRWEEWIVGLPLLSIALGIQALPNIARTMQEHEPWQGRGQRRRYHDAVRLHVRYMDLELIHLTSTWGVMLVNQPTWREALLPQFTKFPTFHTWEEAGAWIQKDQIEAIVEGRLGIESREGFDPKETWNGKLLDLLTTLPDIDKQMGWITKKRLDPLTTIATLLASIPMQGRKA